MEVNIEWKPGKYPSFNILLSTSPGKDPFITIRGCQIKSGQKGEFISYPARKQDDGKYFNFVYGADTFNRVVLEKAHQAKPAEPKPSKSGSGFDDMDSDVPF